MLSREAVILMQYLYCLNLTLIRDGYDHEYKKSSVAGLVSSLDILSDACPKTE
jgi:hypothetical protein